MSGADAERWDRIKSLLGQAIEIEAAERAAFLDQRCAGEPELRAELASLLAAHEANAPTEALLDAERTTQRIGPYQLLQRLGEGGMGVVWLAEQHAPVRRQVALKVIKLGMDTKEVVARFESERQALAVMDHPNIAHVYDAGTTREGRPFFAMELVRGMPVNEYCDQQRLSLAERLRLFLPICEAVQHAHQKGVIHRDLKPSNILVTQAGGRGVPKIIDFGVAKATGQRLTDKTLFTHVGQIVGTLEYMSPEQLDLTGLDIDTRADIYALGVVLYELLAGKLPFDAAAMRKTPFPELQRMIRETEPPRPSARFTAVGEEAPELARRRGTDPRSLSHALRGDLDWIVMKALEKDRARRYDTANGLALDLRRFLAHEPVVARPPSTAYRLRKFVRRNRVGVAFGTALALAVVAGGVGTTVGLVRSRTQARRVTAINAFLSDMLTAIKPDKAQGKEVTVREMLDQAATKIDTELREEPALEAEMRAVIGATYSDLGLSAQAEPHLRRAVELRRALAGPEHAATLTVANKLAMNQFLAGELAEAESLWRDLLERHRETVGDEHPDTLTVLQNIAAVLLRQERYAEAEPLLVSALEGRKRVLGPDHPQVGATASNLAHVYQETGRLEAAEPLLVDLLAARRRLLGDEHTRTLSCLYNLGDLYRRMGRLAEAEPMQRTALEGFRKVQGEAHPNTLEVQGGLADTLLALGRAAEAEPLARACHAGASASFGPDAPETAAAARRLAGVRAALAR